MCFYKGSNNQTAFVARGSVYCKWPASVTCSIFSFKDLNSLYNSTTLANTEGKGGGSSSWPQFAVQQMLILSFLQALMPSLASLTSRRIVKPLTVFRQALSSSLFFCILNLLLFDEYTLAVRFYLAFKLSDNKYNINMSFHFTTAEKTKIQRLVKTYKNRNPTLDFSKNYKPNSSQDQKLKSDMLTCLEILGNHTDEKNELTVYVKSVLLRNKCLSSSRFNHTKVQQIEGVKLLERQIQDLTSISRSYFRLISFLAEMRDLTEKDIDSYLNEVYRAKELNMNEKQSLIQLSKRIVSASKVEKINDDQIVQEKLLTKFLQFGVADAIEQKEKLHNSKIKQKWELVFDKLMTQWYNVNNFQCPLRKFLSSLSHQGYSNQQIEGNLNNLSAKAKLICEPIYKEICRLRDLIKEKPAGYADRYRFTYLLPSETKKAEEQSIKQLQIDYQSANRKLLQFEGKYQKMEWLLRKLSVIDQQDNAQSLQDAFRSQKEENRRNLHIILKNLKKTREMPVKQEQFQLKVRKAHLTKDEIQKKLEDRIKELEEDILRIDLQLKQVRDENVKLAEKLNSKTATAQELERQVQDHIDRAEYYKEKIQELQIKVNLLEKNRPASHQKFEQPARNSVQVAKLKETLQQYRRKVSRIQGQREQLINQNERLQAQMKKKEGIIANFQKKQAELMKKMKNDLEVKEKFISDLRQENTLLRKMSCKSSQASNNSIHKKKGDQKQKKQAETQVQLEVLELGSAQRKQLQKVRKQCQAMQRELRRRDEQQIEQQHHKIDSLEQLTQELHEQIAHLRHDLEEKDSRIQYLQTNRAYHP